jgi:hypothetical protein
MWCSGCWRELVETKLDNHGEHPKRHVGTQSKILVTHGNDHGRALLPARRLTDLHRYRSDPFGAAAALSPTPKRHSEIRGRIARHCGGLMEIIAAIAVPVFVFILFILLVLTYCARKGACQ